MLHLKKYKLRFKKKFWITSGIQKSVYIKKQTINEIHQQKGSTNKGCFS